MLLDKDEEQDTKASEFLASCCDKDQGLSNKASDIDVELDLLHILEASIYKANIANPNNFSSSSYLDDEEPEIHERAMSGSYTP